MVSRISVFALSSPICSKQNIKRFSSTMNNEGRFTRSFNKWGSSQRAGGRGGRYNNRGFGGRQHVRDQNQSYGGYHGNRAQSYSRGNQNRRPRRETPGTRLSEDDIGVTEYVSDHEGFLGIIKSRYSDFQVSEINDRGEIAQLTDLKPPQLADDGVIEDDEDLLLSKYNLEILPMETWDSINRLAIGKATEEKVEIDVSGKSKEQRTKIHEAVKKAFGANIVGSTVSTDDKKIVQFQKFRKGVRIDRRVKWAWPGEYLQFVVYKENCDTMEAAVRIGERLRLNIKASMLGYAGTKDRRAKTSQWFTLRKIDPRRVSTACQELRDVWVGNYSFRSDQLKLGMLQGNRFRIALRNVTVSDETVSLACVRLKQDGFINYYGLQRFGARVDTPTYDVGRKLLQGKFKEAIAAILEVREGPIEHALRIFKLSGAEAASQVLPSRPPRGAAIETRLLKALGQRPNDLLGALNKLARNSRLLYLHSYQSLIWNRCVSERLRRFGLKPAVGDLVSEARIVEEELDERSDDEETDDENITQDDGDIEHKMADKADHRPSLETSIKDKQTVPVRILTQEDVSSGRFSMSDIVLPLPGRLITYPPNMREYYEELLKMDGLGLEMKHQFKSYTLSGAYRHLLIRPTDVEWRCVRYNDPHADLILSDRDRLEGRELQGIVEDGKFKALLISLTLPSSCYATMALRELLKVDTACDNQALQNNYHKKKEETKDKDAVADRKDTVVDRKDAVVDGKDAVVEGKDAVVDGKDAVVEGKDAVVDGKDAVVEGKGAELDRKDTEVEVMDTEEDVKGTEVAVKGIEVGGKDTEMEKNGERNIELEILSGEKRKLHSDGVDVKKLKQE